MGEDWTPSRGGRIPFQASAGLPPPKEYIFTTETQGHRDLPDKNIGKDFVCNR